MSQLYIYGEGREIRLSSGQLLSTDSASGIPVKDADGLVIAGNATISTPAIRSLLEQGKEIVFANKIGTPYAYMLPLSGNRTVLRNRQHLAYHSGKRQEIAKMILLEKLRSEAKTIQELSYQNSSICWSSFSDLYRKTLEQVRKADNIPALLGLEGRMAASYFKSLQKHLRISTEPRGRFATDPLNALLNLSYSVYTNKIIGLLQAQNLDPFLGFLHGIQDGRPSLACDCLEPIRSGLDQLTVKTLNLRRIAEKDFSSTDKGLRLLPAPFKKFLDILQEKEVEMLSQAQETVMQIVRILQRE